MPETVTVKDRLAVGSHHQVGAWGLVGLVGAGVLREAVAEVLATSQSEVCALEASGLVPEQVAGCAAVLVVSDAWDTRPYPVVREVCVRARVGWLPVRVELGQAVISPFS